MVNNKGWMTNDEAWMKNTEQWIQSLFDNYDNNTVLWMVG